jgi:hypothetical protein
MDNLRKMSRVCSAPELPAMCRGFKAGLRAIGIRRIWETFDDDQIRQIRMITSAGHVNIPVLKTRAMLNFSEYLYQLAETLTASDGPKLAYLLRPTSPHGKELVKQFRNTTVHNDF